MAYIGREPQIGNFQVCDAISVVNGQAAYTMQVGGVNASPETANHCLVSLNGILQAPTTSFTVAGSTITFASNLVTGDVINFIQILGSVLDLGVPSDSTVSLAKLTATGTKDSTTFLRGDNSFAAPSGGKVLQVVSVNKTDTFSSSSTSFTDITGLTATITPSATSSKILVNVSIYAGGDGGARYGYKLVRVSTDISLGDAASSRTRSTAAGLSTDGQSIVSQPIVFLDSPSSTSSTAYKIQGRSESGNSFMVNRSSTDTDSATVFRLPSTITLIEIGV